jgi:hypothetical protein
MAPRRAAPHETAGSGPTTTGGLPALGAATAATTTAATATTTTTTAAATTTTAAAAAAAAITTAFAGPGDVDVERTAIENGAVHAVDGALSFVARSVLHEAETSGLAAVTIRDDACRHDVSVRREGVQEVLVAGGIGKITYVEFVHFCLPDMLLRLKTLGQNARRNAFSRRASHLGKSQLQIQTRAADRRYTLTAGPTNLAWFFDFASPDLVESYRPLAVQDAICCCRLNCRWLPGQTASSGSGS